LSHLPTDPFPSDHAAVSAAIAMATYMRWKKNNDPFFVKLSYFFWFASLTMWLSRVSVAIHWPTDVLAGWLVGISLTALLFQSKIWSRLKRTIFKPLIALEKRIFKTCFKIEQE
jgi:undecaprenyl-diphosphatase